MANNETLQGYEDHIDRMEQALLALEGVQINVPMMADAARGIIDAKESLNIEIRRYTVLAAGLRQQAQRDREIYDEMDGSAMMDCSVEDLY